jgi:uncharacterized integral membrane protein
MDTDFKYRIGFAIGGLMISVAIFYDFLEFIFDIYVGPGQIFALGIDVMATMTFSVWFSWYGINLGSPKAVARFWLANVVELLPIPLLDFCLTTLGVVLMIKSSRKEDRSLAEDKKTSAVTKKINGRSRRGK